MSQRINEAESKRLRELAERATPASRSTPIDWHVQWNDAELSYARTACEQFPAALEQLQKAMELLGRLPGFHAINCSVQDESPDCSCGVDESEALLREYFETEGK